MDCDRNTRTRLGQPLLVILFRCIRQGNFRYTYRFNLALLCSMCRFRISVYIVPLYDDYNGLTRHRRNVYLPLSRFSQRLRPVNTFLGSVRPRTGGKMKRRDTSIDRPTWSSHTLRGGVIQPEPPVNGLSKIQKIPLLRGTKSKKSGRRNKIAFLKEKRFLQNSDRDKAIDIKTSTTMAKLLPIIKNDPLSRIKTFFFPHIQSLLPLVSTPVTMPAPISELVTRLIYSFAYENAPNKR